MEYKPTSSPPTTNIGPQTRSVHWSVWVMLSPAVGLLITGASLLAFHSFLELTGTVGKYPQLEALVSTFFGGLFVLLSVLFFICVPLGIIAYFSKTPSVQQRPSQTNTQGSTHVPPEIKGWTWGAAGMTFIWGLYHRVWLSLLVFVPFLSGIWWIVLGIKGNEWAWKKGQWTSVEEFKKSQVSWRTWGIIFLLFPLITFSLALTSVLKNGIDKLNNFTSGVHSYQSEEIEYNLVYNASVWSPSNLVGGDETDFELQHRESDTYAIIIINEEHFGLEAIRENAIKNFEDFTDNFKVINEEYDVYKGKQILEIEVLADVEQDQFHYLNWYASEPEGSVQMSTFTFAEKFPDREEDMRALLNSFQIGEEDSSSIIYNQP